MNKLRTHLCQTVLVLMTYIFVVGAYAQSRNLAPGFSARSLDSKLLVMPVDMELFSISAGGVREPKADWTQAAIKNFNLSLKNQPNLIKSNISSLSDKELDEFAELNALHGAVAQSIFIHHLSANTIKLPTKNDQLLWSLGDSVKGLREKTGADYALFTWIQDSYASAERKVAMVALAILGVGVAGGSQVGYASLVDLRTGQIVWFNNLRRSTGDLREEKSASETVETLLKDFPSAK